jgi:aryl-alcohol dehydrogenase-like predicted oxidoreductase
MGITTNPSGTFSVAVGQSATRIFRVASSAATGQFNVPAAGSSSSLCHSADLALTVQAGVVLNLPRSSLHNNSANHSLAAIIQFLRPNREPYGAFCWGDSISAKRKMNTRKLGNSDLHITPVGFGAWAIGGGGWEYSWGAQEDSDSIAAIHRALELGVNWIDTAAVYGLGHSEEVVARALENWEGQRPYVFTKCILAWDEKGTIAPNFDPVSIRRECDASLRRLKSERIDLYQIHWPPQDNGPGLEAAWQTLANLQKEGKVRWIGVSNFNKVQIQRAEKIAPVSSLQPPYSILRRQIEADLLPYCEQQQIGVIVYSPMFSGMLTGAMTRERAAALPADDFRSRNAEYKEPRLSRNLELVEKLREIGARYGRTPGEVAIAWTLRNPAVTGAIVGARNAKQAEQVMRAADFRLTAEELAEIEAFSNTIARAKAAI